MHLSRIRIINFRNFSEFDVKLAGNVVIVGENCVGKSNLLYALRLLLDPTLPDSSRQLGQADFWDGLGEISHLHKIVISVEIQEFEENLNILALLTDFRLDEEPDTVRLTYEFRSKSDLIDSPAKDDDFEFVCYGGENETKRFSHELRRRVTLDLLPALRDAESELANWRRSPIRPLIESAFSTINREAFDEIKEAIGEATERLTAFESVRLLEENLSTLFLNMSGSKQDIKPSLGFGPTDVTRLYRNIRLLIDDGRRSINDASLGSANIAFLALKVLELKRLMAENQRNHTLLAIEEPESHLYPHLQRSVYRHLFEEMSNDEDENNSLSILLTTHSPHIASVAPLRSLLLLKERDNATIGCSTASISLSNEEEDDLVRYLDVTRAEILFARGIILVEGDAEKFLLPVFSKTIGYSLDHLGITVCSVAGTNFAPYAKLLATLCIPFSIITDWDPREGKRPLGANRAINLINIIEHIRTGQLPEDLIQELNAITDWGTLEERCDEFGVFTNVHTLEVDLFESGLNHQIIETLREQKLGTKKREWIDNWEADPDSLEVDKYLDMIEVIGKGRFAQRLASRLSGIQPPAYIQKAIEFVVNRV